MNSFSVMRAFLHLMLLSMPGIHARGSVRPITCDAGTYAPGQSAFITCNLQKIMPLTDVDVDVILERYPSNSTIGKEIMTCQQHEGGRKRQCNIKREGYTLVNTSMERPTVMIPFVKNESAGLYMCYIVPSKETTSHVCQLTVKGKKQLSSMFPSSSSRDRTSDTGTTVASSSTKEPASERPPNSNDQPGIWIPIGVTGFILLVVANIAIGLWIVLKKKGRPRLPPPPSQHNVRRAGGDGVMFHVLHARQLERESFVSVQGHLYSDIPDEDTHENNQAAGGLPPVPESSMPDDYLHPVASSRKATTGQEAGSNISAIAEATRQMQQPPASREAPITRPEAVVSANNDPTYGNTTDIPENIL